MLRMGHRRRAVPVYLLFGPALILAVATGTLALPGATRLQGLSGSRPVITTVLPPFPAEIRPQQGPGPLPDANLTPNTPASSELDPFAWNDGTTDRILFVSNGVDLNRDGRIDDTIPVGVTPKFNVWMMRPDGSEQIQMTDIPGDSREAAYNATRNMLALANNQTRTWQIYTYEIATRILRQITVGAGDKRHPTWSPDANWIAFDSNAGGKRDIYKIASNGAGSPIRLTTGAGDNTDPSWRPGGTVIVYTARVGAVTRIYQVDEDGTNATALSNGGGDPLASDKQPCWQNNGSTIAFSSNRLTGDGDTRYNYNIWRMPAGGEISGATATLSADAAPTDTFDNTYPTISVPMNRQEMRIVYGSNKTSPARDDLDLYSHFLQDVLPPRLLEIPSVDNRLPAPGGEVTVSVPVFDVTSGVREVRAFFRDPDRKVYSVRLDDSFDSGFLAGHRYLETDSVTVGSTELTDPDGNGIFTGTFTTALAPHDYIIDIQATDNAGNSLRYDNLYGFSTRVFTPTGKILFVDDYCEGQKYIAQLGNNNDAFVGYPVESYYRYNPGFEESCPGTVDYDTIAGDFGLSYDTWRVICRGRVPATIYPIYKPTVEYQLDPATAVSDPVNAAPTRRVPVSEHMIVWAAPHTGNVWVPNDSGSIVDAAVQADLTNYLNSGGKLIITGQDIAWALTLNGTTPNAFLSNTLRATFVTDVAFGYGFTASSQAGDPVAAAAGWGNCTDGGDAPLQLESPRVTNNFGDGWKRDAADNSYHPDVISVQAPANKMYGYAAQGSFSFAGPDAGLYYQDNTTGAQLIYLAFGLEQIHRGYHQPSGLPRHCRNHRSNFITNAYIWMTTGTFQGRVLGIDGKPITSPNPIVRLIQGTVRYAVRVQDDGSYVINGVAPGGYTMEAYRPGYQIDKSEGNFTHAGLGPVVQDFALSLATPGAIAGTVTSQATGEFLSNIKITIYEAVDATPPATGFVKGRQVATTSTAADGTYSVGGLPPGKYIVEADGSATGYSTNEQTVDVVSGNSTTVNFQLTSAPGTLVVTVLGQGTGTPPPPPTPLVGATVQVKQGAVVIQTGATDATGKATFQLGAGSYSVVASAAGYGVSAAVGATVTSATTTNVSVTLSPEPPGVLSGRIVSATSGAPIGDITVHLQVNGVDVVTPVKSSSTFTTPPVGEPYNYRFPSAPTGLVDVVPEAPGFTVQPVLRSVTVATGQETAGVNFQLSSLHTFPPGLSLMSTPYDYPYRLSGGVDTNDPARLLSLGGADLLLASWMPLGNRYAVYPDAPADHFRLGRGYWLKLAQNTDLSRAGVLAADPYPVPVRAGWNLVGDPFTQQIDFTSIQVEDQNHTLMSLQQAITATPPKLQGTLFAYVLGGYRMVSTLSPWVGYWLRAGEPLTLWISAKTGGLALGTEPAVSPTQARWGVAVPAQGWVLPLTVSAGACRDEATILAVSPQGADGYDSRTDLLKPPPADFQPYVYAGLVKDGAPGALALDTRAPAGQQSWVLSVTTNQQGAPVVLNWPDLSLVPNDVRPVLQDLATGRRVYMRTTSGYRFTGSEGERRFRITATSGPAGPAVISALSAVPGVGRISLSYTLGTDAAVSVEIRNLSGVLVRRLVTRLPQAAGVQTLYWNGRGDSGAAVPAGRYLINVRAETPEGQVAQAVSGAWLGR